MNKIEELEDRIHILENCMNYLLKHPIIRDIMGEVMLKEIDGLKPKRRKNGNKN